jgi:arginase family enzyme
MIAGADIVECNPCFDRADVTAITAAKFVREIAARMAATKRAG